MSENQLLLHKIFIGACAVTLLCITVLIWAEGWKWGVGFIGSCGVITAWTTDKQIKAARADEKKEV